MPDDKINEDRVPIKYNNFHKIIITQAILCILIITSILIIKFVDNSTFKEIKEFFIEYFCCETSVDEVLGESEL